MSHSVIKAEAYKRFIYGLLSAILLLTTALSAFASSDHTSQVTTLKSDTASCAALQKSSLYSTEKSTRHHAMNCMFTQSQEYQQKNRTARQQYFAYKAQAWLSYAIHQNSMDSRSSSGPQAAQMAEDILAVLNNGSEQDLPLIQDIPSNSALMRPDLWATLSALKERGGITSAPREIAFSEVALIWAATNYCERGGREFGSHFRTADRWLEQAREAYVNTHNSHTNVALETLIVSYYKQYTPLEKGDDACHGQVLTSVQ